MKHKRVQIDKHLSDMSAIKHDLQHEDDLSSLLFNIALEYAISRIQGNQEDLKLNGTH
jgi:hypothetical protein